MLSLLLLIAVVFADDTCTGNVDPECFTCNDGVSVLDNKKCVTPQSKAEGCLKYDIDNKKCTECTDYYYLNNGTCSQITIEKCIRQNADGNCTFCEHKMGVSKDGKCVECESKATSCNYDEDEDAIINQCYGIFEDKECKEFKTDIENCELQNSTLIEGENETETNCIRCKEGYSKYYENGTMICIEITVENCASMKSKTDCSTCKAGFKLDGNKCSPVTEIEHCKEVNKDKGICDKCEDGYTQSNEKLICVPKGLEHCIETNVDETTNSTNATVFCVKCESHYGIKEDGTCGKCDDGDCMFCGPDLKTCYDCVHITDLNEDIKEYLLKDKECVEYVSAGLELWEKILILVGIILGLILIIALIVVIIVVVCCCCKKGDKSTYGTIN